MNNVLVYTFWLILTVNILGSQIAERYLIYLIPFLCILIAHSITAPLTEKAFSFKIVYTLLLLFQLGTFVAMAVDIFSKNQDYNALHEQILKHIPVKNATVLAPYQFIFEAIPGQNMVSFKRIEYEQALNHHELNQEEIFARAMAYHVNYVIIPRKGLICENASLNAFDQHPILPDSLYHEIYSDQFAVILQRTETGK
jgi:hypothetical protein